MDFLRLILLGSLVQCALLQPKPPNFVIMLMAFTCREGLMPLTVSYQLGSLMDLYTTFITLAGGKIPTDRIVDGIDLSQTLLKQTITDRPIFYYHGNEMMAVRWWDYKAHFWTWINSKDEFNKGVDFCPGQDISGVTRHEQKDYSQGPLLFHLGRDPGEKYLVRPEAEEYKQAMVKIMNIVKEHRSKLKAGEP